MSPGPLLFGIDFCVRCTPLLVYRVLLRGAALRENDDRNASQFASLRRWNIAMSVLHLVQGIAILALSTDFSVTVTTSFLRFMPEIGRPETATEELFSLRLGPMVAAFLFISSIAHFIMAWPAYRWYVRKLKSNINYVRWYEYSLSASLMIVIIALLSGVFDLPSLIMLFALTAVMNLFGLMMELHNQRTERTNWTAYIFGWIAGVIPWIIIAWYFFTAISSAGEAVPTFVYYILGSLFILFFSFAVNMLLQYKGVGRWRDYLYGERGYMILSLVAKSALAWQVFGGTLREM
ncbi:MAG: heliorhodopsin HeR [Dehalococcoidia bacterium]|nr:heliorhodopsin HeR [Dehalococcoidia bacterium]